MSWALDNISDVFGASDRVKWYKCMVMHTYDILSLFVIKSTQVSRNIILNYRS